MALKVKDRDQHLQAPRAPRIRPAGIAGVKRNAPGIIGSATVAHAGLAHADRGRCRSSPRVSGRCPCRTTRLRPVAVFQIDMLGEEIRANLGLDRLGQAGPAAPLRSTSVSGSANDPG